MKVTQCFTFEAAHRLPHVPQGHPCVNLHGHSYRVELAIEGPVDAATGFVIDFFDIEKAFAPVLAELDRAFLNEIAGLENPTVENIAIWIWQRTKAQLPLLASVRVYETKDCWAEYEGA